MNRFVQNAGAYMTRMKIKQTYVSMKSGIDTKKLSRIFTGAQDITATDMEKIADALGQKMDFFLQEDFSVPEIDGFMPRRAAFYAGNPTAEQEAAAVKIIELLENVDEVLSARYRFLNISGVR